jgi:Mor family transcriptional regulator
MLGQKFAHIAQEVIADYQSGLSLNDLVRRYGFSMGTAYNILNTHNIPRRPIGKNSPEQWTPERRQKQSEVAKKHLDSRGRRYKLSHVKVYPSRRGEKPSFLARRQNSFGNEN